MIEAWWWASGVKVNNHPGLGALWFLTTLFWLRVIVDIIIIVFKKRYEWFVFVLLAAIGVFLGKHRIWLPQNMDVTLVALLFFYIGIQLKKYEIFISQNSKLILLASLILWGFCLYKGIFIELAIRHYPRNIISIIEAIGATYVICVICKEIERIKNLERIFSFLGSHTLIIFIAHHLDRFFSYYWWNNSVVLMNIERLFVVLIVALVIYLGQEIYEKERIKYRK